MGIHPQCCTLYGFAQIYYDMYLPLLYHTDNSNISAMLWCDACLLCLFKHFLPFSIPHNFFPLQLDIYQGKRTSINRPHTVLKQRGGEVFYNAIIRSQSFGEPMPPHWESHKYFSDFFSPSLMQDRMAREGWSSVCPSRTWNATAM